LLTRIVAIHQKSRGVYGSPRVFKALRQAGVRVGKKRVERLMQLRGLRGRVVEVTRRQPGLKRFQASGENLRLSQPDVTKPNQVWVADITYLKVDQRWRYLAVIMDLYSRRILGWSLGRNRTTDLTLKAFNYAMRRRGGQGPEIFHSDRGVEYVGQRYRHELKRRGIRPSVNRPRYCTDNAHMESFFHSLKGELIRGRRFQSEGQLRKALNGYINQFYNYQRLHSGINYQVPALYERMAA